MKHAWIKSLCFLLALGNLCGCQKNTEGILPDEERTDPEEAGTVSERLDQTLDSFLWDGETLPETLDTGERVEWSVKSGNAEIRDCAIYKTSDAAEYEPVELHAVITSADQTVSADYGNLLLLDPQIGWVMSYFTADGSDPETLKLSYSFDGTYWFKLNQDSSILKADTGTGRIRDPYLVRQKDGSFTLLATQGYNTSSIYAWDSTDLITYTDERLLKVNASSSELKMSEKQAWAPEAFYDRITDRYVIYWSSPDDGGMFYNTSTDLHSFSYPASLLDAGFTVIDGTIIKEGYFYSIILKDEREPMEEYSQLFVGTSDSDYLHFTHFSDAITGHQSEGPFVLQRTEDTLVYYDDYTRSQFNGLKCSSVKSGIFSALDSSEFMMPMDRPAHAGAIAVTWKELDRLMQKYGS